MTYFKYIMSANSKKTRTIKSNNLQEAENTLLKLLKKDGDFVEILALTGQNISKVTKKTGEHHHTNKGYIFNLYNKKDAKKIGITLF